MKVVVKNTDFIKAWLGSKYLSWNKSEVRLLLCTQVHRYTCTPVQEVRCTGIIYFDISLSCGNF